MVQGPTTATTNRLRTTVDDRVQVHARDSLSCSRSVSLLSCQVRSTEWLVLCSTDRQSIIFNESNLRILSTTENENVSEVQVMIYPIISLSVPPFKFIKLSAYLHSLGHVDKKSMTTSHPYGVQYSVLSDNNISIKASIYPPTTSQINIHIRV